MPIASRKSTSIPFSCARLDKVSSLRMRWLLRSRSMGTKQMKCKQLPGIISLTLVAAFASAPSIAQTYPTKAVRLVVPFLAGGSTDIVGRTVAQKLSEMWGQQAFDDNRPGGGTTIGTDMVAKAAPDGYTLLVTPAPFTINPSLLAKLPYDALT